MSMPRKQLIEIINAVPDEKIGHVLTIFRDISRLLDIHSLSQSDSATSLTAEVEKLRGIVRSDIDEKKELAEARSEKYESFSWHKCPYGLSCQ